MSTLIFDFDGTLADTFFIAVGVFRRLSRRARSSHPTDDQEVEILRGLPIKQVFKRVGVHWWQVPYIVYEGRKAVQQHMDEVKAISGIKTVIRDLHKQGHTIMIVSTNSDANISRFLKNNDMDGCFDAVYGGIGLFSKARTLAKLMAGQDPASFFYIGDEVRDIDAARHAGVQCISVAWGYNNEGALKRAGATTVVSEPKELLQLLHKK